MKELILIRGLPGSGKSTFAKLILSQMTGNATSWGVAGKGSMLEADQYFYDEWGNYNFDPSKLSLAHKWCKVRCEHHMEDTLPVIIVSNTFTQEWEFQPYLELAQQYGYKTTVLVVENYHQNTSVHNVPQEVMEKMSKRFTFKLL